MEIIEDVKKQPTENVLPLINIVFLLLIFFMIAGTLIQPEALSVTVPNADISTKAEPNKLTIIINTDSNDDLQFSIGNIRQTKEEILKKITTEVSGNTNVIVQIKADSSIKSKNLLDLMDEFGTTGLQSIRLLTLNNSPE